MLANWLNKSMPTTRAKNVQLLMKQLAEMSRGDQLAFLQQLERQDDPELKQAAKDCRARIWGPKPHNDSRDG